jgi:hypothetical protein
VLDFIDDTFGVRVSRIALYKFLKRYGLDQVPGSAPTAAAADARPVPPPPRPTDARPAAAAPPFCTRPRSTQAPSC